MEKFRKHHCWPKPTIGRIRTVRECDFVGGVGPIPVYPVTSTKAVFNEKNENLEDILNNGIKFQDSAWIKYLYTTKIAPYIADGDIAEGLSNITFDSTGNINMNMLGEGQVKFAANYKKDVISISSNNDEDKLYNMTISPREIRIVNPDYDDIVITDGMCQLPYLKLTEINDTGIITSLAGFDEDNTFGEVLLRNGLTINNDNELTINTSNGLTFDNEGKLTLNIGEGLSFDTDGKLNCTVQGSGETSSCSCKITDAKYTNGIELFTFNGTTVYAPEPDVPKISINKELPTLDKEQGYVPLYTIKLNNSEYKIYTHVFNHEFTNKDFNSYHGFLYSEEWNGNKETDAAMFYSLEGFKPFNFKSGTPENPYKAWNGMAATIEIPMTRSVEYTKEAEAETETVTVNVGTLNVTIPGFGFNGSECTAGYIGVNPGAQNAWNAVIKKSDDLANYVITGNGGPIAISDLGGSSSSSVSISNAVTGTSYKLASTDGNNIYKHDGITITNSNITANAFYQTSDERLKENVKDIEVPLEVLLRIPTVNFNFKDKDKLEMGTIAQEVEKICPEIINTDGYGYKSVDYSKLSILALKGLKDLTKRVNELEKLIDKIVGE